MSSPFVLMLVIGILFWGGWPLISNASNLKDPFVRGFLLNVVTAAGFLPFVWGKLSVGTFTSRGGMIILAAGVVNFLGHAFYPRLQVLAGSQLSVYGTIIPALCVVVGALGGTLLYGEPITPLKTIFTLVIVVGIVGLAFVS